MRLGKTMERVFALSILTMIASATLFLIYGWVWSAYLCAITVWVSTIIFMVYGYFEVFLVDH